MTNSCRLLLCLQAWALAALAAAVLAGCQSTLNVHGDLWIDPSPTP